MSVVGSGADAAGAGGDFWRRHGGQPWTFLFTDIVGSTRLKQLLGEEAGVARIQAHHATVRRLLRGFGDAQEVRTSGDSFLIVFARASDAVAFALGLQSELRGDAALGGMGIRDRIGIHRGEAVVQEGQGFKELLGTDVDACARLMALGEADQILLSAEARAEALRDFDVRWAGWVSRVEWRNHGRFFLKGLSGSREVWEVGEAGAARLRAPAAPWRSVRGRTRLIAAGLVLLLLLLLGWPWLMRELTPGAGLSRPRVVALLPDPVMSDTNQLPLLQGILQRVGEDLRTRQSATAQRVRVVPLVELLNERVRTPEEARRQFLASLVIVARLAADTNHWLVELERLDLSEAGRGEVMTVGAARGELGRLPTRVAAQAAIWAGLREAAGGVRTAAPVEGADADAAVRLFLQGVSLLSQSFEPAEGAAEAVAVLSDSVRLDPGSADAFAALAEAFAWRFERSRTEDDLREGFRAAASALAASGAALPDAHYALGLLQMHRGDDAAAVRAFRRAVELDRAHGGARRLLARALLRLGNAGAAEATLFDAVAIEPDNWRGYNSLGWFYRLQPRGAARAEESFRKAVELAPENHLAWANLGGFLLELGRDADAREALDRSIQLRPTAPACSNLGSVEFFSGRFAEAAARYRQAAELEPNDVELQANLADAEWHVAEGRGRAREAYRVTLRLARQSLGINPDQPGVEALLGTALARTGDTEAGLEIAVRLAARTDLGPDSLVSVAMTLSACGRPEEARAALGRALAAGYPPRLAERHPDLAPLRAAP